MKVLIVSTSIGFELQTCEDEDVEHLGNIVAVYNNEEDAEAGLKRAKELEKKLRPMWQAAIEHEARVREMMLLGYCQAA